MQHAIESNDRMVSNFQWFLYSSWLNNSEDEFWLDETSKKVFPFCFMIFNATFWCYAFYGTQGSASFGAQERFRKYMALEISIEHNKGEIEEIENLGYIKMWTLPFYSEFCTFVLSHTFSLTVNSFLNSYLLDSTRIEEIRSFEVKFNFE